MNLPFSGKQLPLCVGGMLIAAVFGTSAPAFAYGAASYSPSTGAYGYTYGRSSASDAMSRANYLCGKSDCRTSWVQNQCVAVARSRSSTRVWATGTGSNRSDASANARFTCGASDCYTVVYACD